MKIEAIFGGILALVVLVVAANLLFSFQLPGQGGGGSGTVSVGSGGSAGTPITAAGGSREQQICGCFDEAFRLAKSNVAVNSSQYVQGFEVCRARAEGVGGEAWTAGWNAALSAKPYTASCRAWMRSGR